QSQTTASEEQSALFRRAFLDQYCITCHNDKLRTGSLSLGPGVGPVNVANSELWEKVERKLRSGVMPPAGTRRPDKPTSTAFLTSLEASLDAVSAAHPNPGRP